MVTIGDKVVVKMGKFEGLTGEVISTDNLKLVVRVNMGDGRTTDVNLYQAHVKPAK